MMYNNSPIIIPKEMNYNKTFNKILKKYPIIKENKCIDINLIFQIHNKMHISKKDIQYIFQISSSTMCNFKKGNQKKTKLKFNKYNGIPDKNLITKNTINYEEFNTLRVQLNVTKCTLMQMLGITPYRYNKMLNDKNYNTPIRDVKTEFIVNLIKLDLKYQYKTNTYHSKRKIKKLCDKYGIDIYQFAEYYSKNPTHRKFNFMILEKSSKGFWFGNDEKIPNEFINKNYDIIMKRLNNVANNVSAIIGCNNYKEDLIHDAMSELYSKCRDIIQNFYFDIKVLFNILMSKAKYFMLNIYRRKYKTEKEFSYDGLIENNNIDHMNIFKDSRFDPQMLLL